MAKFNTKITKRTQQFIEAQQLFFVATAPINGRINVSPKGMDSFRVVNENRVLWLNVTGSGNETAAHLLENNRITILFCSFQGAPNIVRIYGTAKEIKPKDNVWDELITQFPKIPGARQIFDIAIDTVQSSCGMSIPFYEYQGERNQLNDWAKEKSSDELKTYWNERNASSIDGLPTNIISD